MIRIITDSAADMEKWELEKYNVTCVPLSVSFEEDDRDYGQVDKDVFYEKLVGSGVFPKTSQPSPEAFFEKFKEAKDAGDSVVAILLAGELSGTCQSATIAKTMCDYEEIYIIDSWAASAGEKALIFEAAKLKDLGCNAKEIAEKIEALKLRLGLVAGLDTLEYLYKGGRLSKVAAGIGTIANLKPIIKLADGGKVVVAEKSIGVRSTIKHLVKYLQKFDLDESYPIYFLYSYDNTNCKELIDKVSSAGFRVDDPDLTNLGSTLGSHIGVGAYGFFFFTKNNIN